MENRLFRKKSMEHISSPESLHDYMRVTSPRLWMILAAIVVLLAGFIAYASVATMENTMDIKATVENYRIDEDGQEPLTFTFVDVTLPLSYMEVIKPGMKVRIGNEEGEVSYLFTDDEGNLRLDVQFPTDYVNLKDGEYDAKLVLETTTPISFLWN